MDISCFSAFVLALNEFQRSVHIVHWCSYKKEFRGLIFKEGFCIEFGHIFLQFKDVIPLRRSFKLVGLNP